MQHITNTTFVLREQTGMMFEVYVGAETGIEKENEKTKKIYFFYIKNSYPFYFVSRIIVQYLKQGDKRKTIFVVHSLSECSLSFF